MSMLDLRIFTQRFCDFVTILYLNNGFRIYFPASDKLNFMKFRRNKYGFTLEIESHTLLCKRYIFVCVV